MNSDLSGMALNRKLAELQGITIKHESKMVFLYKMTLWLFYDKDGQLIAQVFGLFKRPVKTEEEAWERVFSTYNEGPSTDVKLPDWAHDPGAAAALCYQICHERFWKLAIEYGFEFDCPIVEFTNQAGEAHVMGNQKMRSICNPEIGSTNYASQLADALARLALKALEGEWGK